MRSSASVAIATVVRKNTTRARTKVHLNILVVVGRVEQVFGFGTGC